MISTTLSPISNLLLFLILTLAFIFSGTAKTFTFSILLLTSTL